MRKPCPRAISLLRAGALAALCCVYSAFASKVTVDADGGADYTSLDAVLVLIQATTIDPDTVLFTGSDQDSYTWSTDMSITSVGTLVIRSQETSPDLFPIISKTGGRSWDFYRTTNIWFENLIFASPTTTDEDDCWSNSQSSGKILAFVRCVIRDISSSYFFLKMEGGADNTVYLTNCLFEGNAKLFTFDYWGGAPTIAITNCTFDANTAIFDFSANGLPGTTTNISIKNCIFSNNTTTFPSGDGATLKGLTNYSLTSESISGYGPNGNVSNSNPQYLQSTRANPTDWIITTGSSPAENIGTSSGAPSTDIGGNSRSGSYDAGCWEAASTPPEDYADWSYSTDIILNTTSTGANVSGNVTSFPVLVRLNPYNFHAFSQTQASGVDIRFASSTGTHLDYQIERWVDGASDNDSAWIWVKTDVTGNNNTQKIVMYYGKTSVADKSNSDAVFPSSNSFLGAYHLSDDVADASSNNNDGTNTNTTDIGGIIGKARSFNGSTAFIYLNDLADRSSGSVSCWFKPTSTFNSSTGTSQGIWGKTSGASNNATLTLRGTDFLLGHGSAGELEAKIESSDATAYVSGSTNSFTGSTWYYATFTWGGGSYIMYLNGASQATVSSSQALNNNTAGDEIGRSYYDGNNITGGGPRWFNGVIDEFRLETTNRSANWIKLCYENQKESQSLVSFGGDYTWDLSDASGITTGNGTWDASNTYWTQTSGGGTLRIAWPGAGNSATFGGADGSYAITVSGTHNVDSIAFLYSGYTLSSGTALNFGTKNGILVASGKSATIATPITGTGGVSKYGAGTLILSGADTYSGTTTISAGTLQIGDNGGTGTIDNSTTIANSGTLVFSRTGSYTYSGTISGSGTLTNSGTGTITLSGANTFTGLTTIGAGTLKLGAAGGATNTPLGTIGSGTTVSSGGALDLNGYTLGTAEALTLNSTGVSSGGALMNSGSAATWSGLVTLGSSGVSIVGGTGTIAISNAGTISGSGYNLTLGGAQGGSVTSIIGTGAGTVTKADAGTWTLSGSSTYTGLTTISLGTLKLGAAGGGTNTPLGTTGSGTTVSSGGALDLNGYTLGTAEALTLNSTGVSSGGALTNSSATAATYSGLLTLGSASSIVASSGNIVLSNAGTITGSGYGLTLGGTATGSSIASIIGTDAGTVTKSGSGTWTLSGSSTYTGLTTISLGTLKLGAAGGGTNTPLGTTGSGTTVSSGGALDLNGYTLGTAEALTLNSTGVSSGGALTNSSATAVTYSGLLTLGSASSIVASSGNIVLSNAGTITGSGYGLTLSGTSTGSSCASIIGTGTGTVTKSSTGTWTLSGANTYSGATTISGGTLVVTGSIAGAASVTGGTLAGSGSIGGAVSVSSGGILSPGTSTGILTINNNLTLASGATLAIEVSGTTPGTDHDQVAVNGAVDLAGATLTLTLNYAPTAGETYTIISNDGTEGVTSTFTGIAEGGSKTAPFGGNTYAFTVSYIGGSDNNDVVLSYAGISGENYADWLYSQKIFINTSQSGAALSSNASTIYNFPLLVRLDSTRFYRFFQTAANGADIRFANRHGEHLSYEIERWQDGTGDKDSAAIWVRVDTIRPNSYSNYITMYWGNSSAASNSNDTAVFQKGNGYVGVWHLKEDPTGSPSSAAGAIKDATGNANHATATGTMTSADLVDGVIGKGHDFDGTNDCDSIPYNATLDIANAITLSAWAKVSTYQAYGRILCKGTPIDADPYVMYNLNFQNTNQQLRGEFSTSTSAGSQQNVQGSTTTLGTSNFFYAVFTYDKSSMKLYVNGAQEANTTSNTNPIATNTRPVTIGSPGVSVPATTIHFKGILDEPTLSNVARSADWIKLCYNTQKLNCDTIVDIENYEDWTNSQNITVNTTSTGANVTGTVTRFPMLVRLNPSNFGGFANTLAGGADIRFAKSNGIHLPYQIERWTDVTGNLDTAVIWVLLDTVFGNSSSQYFTMYWDNSRTRTSRSAPRTVFDTANGYSGVWHLSEASAANALDATAAAVTGTASGATTAMAGAIGVGRDFNASTDFITLNTTVIKNALSSGNQKATISFWMNADATAYAGMMVWEGVSTGNGFGTEAETHVCMGGNPLGTGLANKLTYYLGDGSNYPAATPVGNMVHATTDFTDISNWRYVSVTVDYSSSATLYLDGASVNTETGAASISMASYANTIFGKDGAAARAYNGALDEITISDTTRSADWIKLCYETQKPNSQVTVTEDYTTWPYSQKIYLNTSNFSGSDISATQYNFPVLVRLDTVNFRYFSQTLAGGADVRFAKSSGTHLNYEIERWQDNAANNDTAAIWVNIDTVFAYNGSQYITMYWGKPGASSMSNAPLVFPTSSNFSGVWHLANNYNDATANGYNGTSAGTSDTAGVIGRARKFIGANRDSIQIPGLMGQPATVTLSCWAKCDSIDQASVSAEMLTIGDYVNLYVVGGARDSINGAYHYNNSWPITLESSGGANHILKNGWKHFAFVCNPSASLQTIYLNGIQVGTSSISNVIYYTSGGGPNTFIGKHGNANAGYDFGGVIDEPRIENTNRSGPWIKLCYENQKPSQTLCDYEDYSTWPYSRRVTINTNDMALSGNVIKFPLLVRLTADNFDFLQADSSDVRFARSDGVHLLYEKERWDETNQVADLWVLVDTVRNANATQYINMFWGKSGVFSRSNPARVFDTGNGFRGVWHLAETVAGNASDATINAYTATKTGSPTQNVTGNIGQGCTFTSGTSDGFYNASNPIQSANFPFTMSAWVKRASSASAHTLVFLGDATVTTKFNSTQVNASNAGQISASNTSVVSATGATAGDNTWHYVTGVFNGATDRTLYVDNNAGVASVTSVTYAAPTAMSFGYAKKSTPAEYLSGMLDEVRLEDANRSADWIKLCYETQKTSPSATLTDAEAFRPCSLKTTADQCSVWTTGWTVVFDKNQGSAGKYGGITILTDSAHGKTTSNPATPSNSVGTDQNLFYVTYDGVTSMQPSSGGTWAFLDTVGRIYARLRQTCTMSSLPWQIDYTIHGSGKMFIRVSVTNRTGSDITGKTLQFNVRRRVVTNTTVSVGNATANLCPYVLVSCDSARHADPMLALSNLWNSDSGAMTGASGLVNTPASGLAGWENTSWAIAGNQRQVWTFMLDFSHKYANDSAGVGAYANSFRRPDSLEFLAGFPVLEQSWEEYIYGHWKLDETAADTAHDFSGFGYHGIKTASGTWAAGKIGNCLSFSGSQKITVANTQKLDGRSPEGFTVLMWIKPSSAIDASTTLFGKYSAGNLGYKILGTADGKISVKADGSTISGVTAIGTGTWKHVAVSVNTNPNWPRSTMIYINGRLDMRDTTTVTEVSANTEEILIGNGLAGMIDDVRYFYRQLSEESIEAIYKLGFRVANGTYQVRADNNNTVHMRIDGRRYKQRFPVFQIDNYWGAAKPEANCVVYNGSPLTENTHYFCWLDNTYHKLYVALNKTMSADSTLLYIDDKNTEGSRAVLPAKKMVWGKYSGARNWFWCKNFTGDYFGAIGTNQYYFAWKMDTTSTQTSKTRGGEVCRFKSSNLAPYYKPDTSTDSSLMPTDALYGGTPIGHQGFYYSPSLIYVSTNYANTIPTYTVVESSAVRIQLKINERTMSSGSEQARMTTRWTLYPTGQIFRWDSLTSFSHTPWYMYSGGTFQRYLASASCNFAINKSRMRGIVSAASTIHDNVVAFLGFKSLAGTCAYPWKVDTLHDGTIASYKTGMRFSGLDTNGIGTYWSSTPIQMAFYYDYQRNNIGASDDDLYRDSVSNGVQCIGVAGGAALGMTTGTLLHGASATAGDLDTNGFNEREGAYVIRASNNVVVFTLPASRDTCRFYPAFRITNYMANQKPQYLFCYPTDPANHAIDTQALIEGYEYNIYHNRTANELVIQVDSVFCDSAVFYIAADRTLAVEMSKFGASGGDGCDTIRWKTESESENLGYNIYRRIKPQFLDSLAKATDTVAHDTALDGAAALFKKKTIAFGDTGWIRITEKLIPSASGGTAFGPTEYLHVDFRKVYNDVVYEYRIESIDFQNNSESFGPAEARPKGWIPVKFALWGNFPNPFRRMTAIRFDLPIQSKVDIRIYNLQGKLVRKLVRPEKLLKVGRHKAMWDGLTETGQPAATGPYVYHMTAGKRFAKAKIMVMVR